ncbi:MAG TPA: sulfatase-like hydrolase/transferase, partial [Castellaniella sp.]|nr:sulfatase-like hydrolase/transferase [Castellaniella sp.]
MSACDSGSSDVAQGTPNILFVIMDDVGIDQMKSFGYGGATPPNMPNIDAIAKAGVRFRNTWSMPECSPGRASFFVGRYPFRTNINQAIGPNDLANSQLSPYDMTTPKVLKEAGYESAMFGKFHLAGPENNEAENATPSVLGWDYFYGWVGGLPGSVDVKAGNDANVVDLQCGFVPGNGAIGGGPGPNQGACYYADNTCRAIQRTSLLQDPAGLQCLTSGGIFVQSNTCADPAPGTLNFTRENAYYVSPLVIIDGGVVQKLPLTDPRARGYRTTIETNAAIDWIKSRTPRRPWMATVSYSAAHTPWQSPPGNLLASRQASVAGNLNCGDTPTGRLVQNEMTEAMDTEFGRLLVETGLATRAQDGSLRYDPRASNTVIVIVGDNGSLGSAVKLPFDLGRAKGTAYQTGVWDPLIIAGPQVTDPDRDVEHMVNMVDLFQFFGEVADIDVHKAVPRTIDSVGIEAYLTNPSQGSLRNVNFTMAGFNIQKDGGQNGPCVIPGISGNPPTCTQIPTSKSVCGDNGGVWWGADYDPGKGVIDTAPVGAGYKNCGEVNQALYKNDPTTITKVLPQLSVALRNEQYKVVVNQVQTYYPGTDTIDLSDPEYEFYEINQAKPTPQLDTNDLLLGTLTAGQQAAYDDLKAKLGWFDQPGTLLASNPPCPGDGNWDGKVDAQDLANWRRVANGWAQSSVYDFG